MRGYSWSIENGGTNRGSGGVYGLRFPPIRLLSGLDKIAGILCCSQALGFGSHSSHTNILYSATGGSSKTQLRSVTLGANSQFGSPETETENSTRLV